MSVLQTPASAWPARVQDGAGGRRLRLLKFVAAFGSGGTERQFTNLALGLDRARFDLRFGCLRSWGTLKDEIEAADIAVTEYPIRSFYQTASYVQQMRLARDIRRDGVDIVHTYNFYANVFAVPAARLAGVPVVIASIRDMGVYLDPAQRHVQRLACGLADCILVNAEAVKRWLVTDGYDAEKITVIANGIDLQRFAAATPHSDMRQDLGLAARTPVVLLVSRLVRRKGVEHFLDAAARLVPHMPHVRFVIVGEQGPDTNYRAALERYAARVGVTRHVIFTGLRRDVPALMAQATVSVLSSLSEGLSNVLLESMAMGAPVVATRVGGVPEVIEDGVTGLLVPPGHPVALAAAIRRLLEAPDLSARLGAAGQQLVTSRFSLERMISATEQQYTTLLERSRRPRAVAALSR